MFKPLQSLTIKAYRLVAMTVLLTIITGVLSYLGLLVFFAGSSSWAAPMVLSPTQERVLAFQPQIANLESSVLKQRVELATAEAKYLAGAEQLQNIQSLIRRLNGAQKTEARALAETNAAIRSVLSEKSIDITSTDKSIADINRLLQTVETEVSAGLITKDQAQTRRISLQAALNASTDAKAQAIVLQEQARAAKDGASTLNGGASSLQALQSIQEAIQLQTLGVQLRIDTETARQTVEQLKISIEASERVLAVAKTSPYYRALRVPVNVLFAPHENLNSVQAGDVVYDCALEVLFCSKVGEVLKVYDAEEYARHPLFKTDLKGRFVEVKFTDADAAKSKVVFIGGKPLFL